MLKECPQLHKLQLCKELKPPPCSQRSNNYSAYRHDALKLYEWNHREIFFPLKIANSSDGDNVESSLPDLDFIPTLVYSKIQKTSSCVCSVDQSKLLSLSPPPLFHSLFVSFLYTHTRHDCLSLNSIYSHLHILP